MKAIVRWLWIILWGSALIFLVSIPEYFRDSFATGIAGIFFVAVFGFFGYLSFKAWRKPKKRNQAPVKTPEKPAPVKKISTRYKGFALENFNINNLSGCFIFNEEFDYTVPEIKENVLEDWPIYKWKFNLKPEFTRTDNGTLRIMAKGVMIGDLSEKSANEMKYFINTHDGCKPLLEIQGGEYKLYNSDEKVVETGKDPWTAKLLVQYYD